jgi:hypothetical protein
VQATNIFIRFFHLPVHLHTLIRAAPQKAILLARQDFRRFIE